jgi:drug/metabolite transporter (DMT)-like permease
MIPARTLILTVVALIAFAANSIFCRLALNHGLIDPIAFTQTRLLSGALVLFPLLFLRRGKRLFVLGFWRPAVALFAYAIAFSLAYVAMGAGTGALILFATVQITMIGLGVLRGLRPGVLEWLGLGIAFAGLVVLVAPGVTAPPWASAVLMALAGAAWGIYTVIGKGEGDPIHATARNFVLAIPLSLALFAAGPLWSGAKPEGIVLAAVSGALTSAFGYIVWYAALKGLSHMQASIVQVASPVLVAIGGILFLGETFTLRLVVAAGLILGGIVLTIRAVRSSALPAQPTGPSRMSR